MLSTVKLLQVLPLFTTASLFADVLELKFKKGNLNAEQMFTAQASHKALRIYFSLLHLSIEQENLKPVKTAHFQW